MNGQLVTEGQHVQVRSLFKHLGCNCKVVGCGQGWLKDRGSLPDAIDDVKEEG